MVLAWTGAVERRNAQVRHFHPCGLRDAAYIVPAHHRRIHDRASLARTMQVVLTPPLLSCFVRL